MLHIVCYEITRGDKIIHGCRVVDWSGLLNEKDILRLEQNLTTGLEGARAKMVNWDVLLDASAHPPIRGAYHYHISYVVVKEDDTSEAHVAIIRWPHVIRDDSDLDAIRKRLCDMRQAAYAALKSCKPLRW